MKYVLAILSLVLFFAFTANAQTETDLKKEQTLQTEKSSSDNQPTLSVSEDGKKECEVKSKEECKRICKEKEKADLHKSHEEMGKKECKPDCKMECCANTTEEVLQKDGT